MGRIEFIDLAKGVCIILVVMFHVGIDIPHLDIIRMPLYFIISGLFYKPYDSITSFCIKKTNKILIPFISFYILSYSIFYILKYVVTDIPLLDNGLQDVFIAHHIFNTPIWFLLCLYWVSLLFNTLWYLLKNKYLLLFAVFSIGFIGNLLRSHGIWLPLFIDSSFSALPFYYIGFLLKQSRILLPNKLDKLCLPISIVLFLVTILVARLTDIHLDVQYNNVPILSYLVSTIGVIAVLLLCKHFRYIPIVSYFGRFSIIILLTHNLVYSFIKVAGDKLGLIFPGFEWIQLVAVLIASLLLIQLCKKYIPMLVAQKDLIKI